MYQVRSATTVSESVSKPKRQSQTSPSVCSGCPVLCGHLQLAIPLLIMKCIPLAQHRHPQPGLNHQMLMLLGRCFAAKQPQQNLQYSKRKDPSYYIPLLAKKPDEVDEKYRIDSHLAISPLERWKTMKLDQCRALSIRKICVCRLQYFICLPIETQPHI